MTIAERNTTQVGGLLPLPEPVCQGEHPDFPGLIYGYNADHMHVYAQANVQAEREKYSQLEARLVELAEKWREESTGGYDDEPFSEIAARLTMMNCADELTALLESKPVADMYVLNVPMPEFDGMTLREVLAAADFPAHDIAAIVRAALRAQPSEPQGVPEGMVMVQRSDAERLARHITVIDDAATILSARRILALLSAPAGNAGGEVEAWIREIDGAICTPREKHLCLVQDASTYTVPLIRKLAPSQEKAS